MSQFAYRAALFGAALALLGGAALGQSSLPPFNVPLQPPPEDSVVGDVIIEAPKFVERNRMGVITQEMSLSVRVPYNDLDMHTPTGVAELDRRVSAAAAYVCAQLERKYPDGSPERFYCAKNAIAGAKPQVIKAHNAP